MTTCSPDISVVVPVYNSAHIIPVLVSKVEKALNSNSIIYELILADDCSTDGSWQVIEKLYSTNKKIMGLRLGENCGQWYSSLAGISKASGRYIVTIDDDLEYDPADILKLYAAITSNNHYVVFGMAKEKYPLQGKSRQFSNWRNHFLNIVWNKAPTDSFKIFERNLVFEGMRFLPEVCFEAFITHKVDKKYFGYCQVGFNKRHSGTSNHSLRKKINLFFLYSSHYMLNPMKYLVVFSVLIFAIIFLAAFLYTKQHIHNPFLLVFETPLVLIGGVILFYLSQVFLKHKKLDLSLIVEELKTNNG